MNNIQYLKLTDRKGKKTTLLCCTLLVNINNIQEDKITIYKGAVRPEVLYGLQTWLTAKYDEKHRFCQENSKELFHTSGNITVEFSESESTEKYTDFFL